MVTAAVTDLESDAAGSSLAQLNQSLAANVTRVCEDIIANRFPFANSNSREVGMTDFARLFAPGGVMDGFFAAEPRAARRSLGRALDLARGHRARPRALATPRSASSSAPPKSATPSSRRARRRRRSR